jgi:hypothetical protein
MLKCIITFYEQSQKAIADSPPEKKVTWAYIKTTLTHLIIKVQETKFLVSCFCFVSVPIFVCYQIFFFFLPGTKIAKS